MKHTTKAMLLIGVTTLLLISAIGCASNLKLSPDQIEQVKDLLEYSNYAINVNKLDSLPIPTNTYYTDDYKAEGGYILLRSYFAWDRKGYSFYEIPLSINQNHIIDIIPLSETAKTHLLKSLGIN